MCVCMPVYVQCSAVKRVSKTRSIHDERLVLFSRCERERTRMRKRTCNVIKRIAFIIRVRSACKSFSRTTSSADAHAHRQEHAIFKQTYLAQTTLRNRPERVACACERSMQLYMFLLAMVVTGARNTLICARVCGARSLCFGCVHRCRGGAHGHEMHACSAGLANTFVRGVCVYVYGYEIS